MSKHTPGPWRFYENTASTQEVPCIDVEGSNRATVAYLQAFPNHNLSADECRANARVMSAAPDLLAAAYETVSALREAFRITPGSDDDFIYDEMGSGPAAAYFSARAAITKATGEES